LAINKKAFVSGEGFLAVLKPFLEEAPEGIPVRARNPQQSWLNAEFADLLREHKIALVLQDQIWVPLPSAMAFDYYTTDFTYVRLLGDRQGIEKQTKVWDKEIVNRGKELRSWVGVCHQPTRRGVNVGIYVNNHYAGHAPATIAKFLKLWEKD
jgi:uncharacterized protein YecE (DUF72 family)